MTKITETPAPSADTLSPASTLFRDLQSLKLSIEKVEAEVRAFISLEKRTTDVAFRETLNQAIESNMDFASSSFLPGVPQLHEVAASDREDLLALIRAAEKVAAELAGLTKTSVFSRIMHIVGVLTLCGFTLGAMMFIAAP